MLGAGIHGEVGTCPDMVELDALTMKIAPAHKEIRGGQFPPGA